MLPDLPPNVPVDVPQTVISPLSTSTPVSTSSSLRVESHGYSYEVVGNTLLDPAVIEARLAAATDPQAAFATVNQAYQEAGYFLVALRGGLRDRTLTIQVVEGQLTEVVGSEDLAPYFRLLRDRPTLNKDEVLRQGTLAEMYDSRQGQQPKISFEPAEAAGGSRMVITETPIENAKSWSANLGVGNYGNRYSSRMLAQAGGSWRPGAGTEFSLGYTVGLPNAYKDSEGSSYDSGTVGGTVVTPWGLFGATYNRSKYAIGGTAGGLLAPTGDIVNWNVNGSQLLYTDAASRWALTESFNSSDTTIKVFDGAYTLTDQAFYYFTLGTAYSRSMQTFGYNSSFSAGVTLQQGVSGQSGTFLPEGDGVPIPRFRIWSGNLGYTQGLPGAFSFGTVLTGQWSEETLPQNQQWVLGGYGNLSAWYPGVVTGDKGVLLRASVATPPWTWGPLSVTGSLFLEGGMSQRNFVPFGGEDTQVLSDGGLGLATSLKTGTALSMGAAWPIHSSGVDEFQADKNRAYFYFNFNQVF